MLAGSTANRQGTVLQYLAHATLGGCGGDDSVTPASAGDKGDKGDECDEGDKGGKWGECDEGDQSDKGDKGEMRVECLQTQNHMGKESHSKAMHTRPGDTIM